MTRIACLIAVCLAFLAVPVLSRAADAPAIRLYSSGSARASLTEIIQAFTAASGIKVEPTYGGAGVLRERIAAGEPADLFVSADLGNPQALSEAGKSGPAVLFAHNSFCAILRPGLKVTPATLLATMLDPSIKIGTSTPKADPAGDYAFEVFRKADAVRSGNRATLEAKAVKTGDVPGSLAIPPNVGNSVAWLFREKRADIFLAYCSNAPDAVAAMPGITTSELPPALNVRANYGLTVLNGANKDGADQLALFILSPAGQKILAKHGFDAPLLP